MCEHPIADVWNDLGLQVVEYLDSVNVTWTTIDPVRFTEAEKDAGPVFLWVDVKPGSLSRENAEVAAVGCKKLLQKFGIIDDAAVKSHSGSRSSPGRSVRSFSIMSLPYTQPPTYAVRSLPHSV